MSISELNKSGPKLIQSDGHSLLEWQYRCDEKFKEKVKQSANDYTNFSLACAPNSGKTDAASRMMYTAKKNKESMKFIVVCPSDIIKNQWPETAQKYGIILSTEINNRTLAQHQKIANDLDGMVITYGQLAQSPLIFRSLCFAKRTMVCFDETHHMAVTKSWGEAALEAFEFAKIRLSLSGTPFRSDGNLIPFQEYK
ncbi:DEAD/DEAH box helicase family protein [Paracoccaceae bacterium]|nr:DEAD/DEAH box helicase family protein [Paracoccaceae bacterium]